MYNGIRGLKSPWSYPGEAWAPDGLNELLELQKCDWGPGLSGGVSQGLRPVPEKFLMDGVDMQPSLSCLPLLTPYLPQDYLWGLGRRGILPQGHVVPGWSDPGLRSRG